MQKFNHVYTTNDYTLFTSIDGNRTKNKLHIKRLKQSIKENYLFTVIIVNENYEIIDGQHRFDVIKELNLPLYYIICEGYGLAEVHILNQISKTQNHGGERQGVSLQACIFRQGRSYPQQIVSAPARRLICNVVAAQK